MAFSIIFLGTSAFAVPSLTALAEDSRFNVQLVITQPDQPVGRKQILTPSPVKTEAQKHGIEVLQPENVNTLLTSNDQLPTRPDFLVVVSYGQMLSQKILDLPLIAPVNVHPSLLPHLRGASPLQHTILEGLKHSGVTVQKMIKEMDAGPMLGQTTYTLDPREAYTSLHDTLAFKGATLLLEVLSQPLNPVEQDHAKATRCTKFTKQDGIADPKLMTAETIDRMVRGLTPWPGVSIGGNKILETSLHSTKDSLPIPCSENTTLFVQKIQPPSGKPMTGKSFSFGHSLSLL